MKHLLQSFCLLAALAACLGLLIPSAEAADKVSYEVNQVTLKGNTITFQGNFVNKSDNYQRVLGLHIKYRLSDIDAYPLLIGAFDSEDLSVDIGKDPVPFTISVTDNQVHNRRRRRMENRRHRRTGITAIPPLQSKREKTAHAKSRITGSDEYVILLFCSTEYAFLIRLVSAGRSDRPAGDYTGR